ncbi:hypothetical protein RUM43_008195 [Polyplax serrata]|uniref:FYVE-type domain-containing protein n=1 Tax=Polyplax serrata TaxID=468196 RepID=A0AAN8S2A1_POLSC
MEKFTVDLDNVLDEFEFNEEQAVRHALQHFKREDLPATKYQKPHFRPINMADADFAPCIETTMSYPAYHQKYTQETITKVAESDLGSTNCNGSNTNHTDLHTNFNNSEAIKECGIGGTEFIYHSSLGSLGSDKFLASNSVTSESEGAAQLDCGTTKVLEGHKNFIHCHNNLITNTKEQEGKVEQVEDEDEQVESNNEGLEDLKEVKTPNDIQETFNVFTNTTVESLEEPISQTAQEVNGVYIENNKPNIDNSNCVGKISVQEEELLNITELPDSTEVNHKEIHEIDAPRVNVQNLSLGSVKLEEEVIPDTVMDKESEVQLEITSRQQQENVKEFYGAPKCQEPSQSDCTPVRDTRMPVIETQVEATEIKPIQFESQQDITDEELQKYLEELEEEEAKEQKLEEAKPSRPDTLNIRRTSLASRQPGSPGQTPLPRGSGSGDFAGVEEDNLRNERSEGYNSQLGDSKEDTEELERLLEASEASEPPLTLEERRLGKVSPFWMPDHLASSCMECDSKFTVIKRRHHCRACGKILCSKCCGLRASLEYLQNQEQRVCENCFRTLARVLTYELQNEADVETSPRRRPNPNNPMEYCSTVPPPLQISSSGSQTPPSVMVPVGVLKREGSSRVKETPKQVMFSDGIRPGGDLTELDESEEPRNAFRKSGRSSKRAGTPPVLLPPIDPVSQSFIVEKSLPPIYVVNKGETSYEENWPLPKIMENLKDPNSPPLLFAINRNLVASVKIVKLDCCMKETCWVICSKGMGCVGQDEIIILLTVNGEEDDQLPKEILLQFHYIYQEAARGTTVNELGYWCVKESTFLDSKQHGGFLFIRPTFQCLNRIELPPPPYLVGILIQRSEVPWARVFPFRLMLRLGAEFRYYPCPLVSVRFREPVYYEIGHTIINLLADFRNLSYTIPNVRGLRIHMEANQTTILIPRNRYDQVVRALNNSNDPVLALAGSFSPEADAHLVCMQSKGNEVTYSTHAININEKTRKVTGASFVVLNGALKTTSGVAAKSSIVEDGLMVQVPSDTMTALRNKLRNMEDWSVCCGPVEGRNVEETVRIIWCEDDRNFNIGVKSGIDNMALDGVPSIRVHSGKDFMGGSKFIRWTQVFIIKCEDGATSAKIGDPLEVNKLSESIARATCFALIKLLDLLAASGSTVLAVRATMDKENVGYEAGSNGQKLGPIYMNSLDNELIPVLHKAASINDSVAILELVFHIMDQ